MNTFQTMETIIVQEIDIYKKLVELEEQKREAITSFNGDMLFALSKEQETCILNLEKLEKIRQQMMRSFAGIHNHSYMMTLKDFIEMTKGNENLIIQAQKLKNEIEKFARLYEANKKLINDNLEFFNAVLSVLRKAVTIETGYSQDGLTKRSASGSVLMNTMA